MRKLTLLIALLALQLIPFKAYCGDLSLNDDYSFEVPSLTFGSNAYSFTLQYVPTPDDTDHHYWRTPVDALKVSSARYAARKNADAKPVIWIGDFNNFDDTIALMLMAKDPGYRIEMVVVEESFNSVAHGANLTYNILEWLGNLETEVIRGAYFAMDEIELGANGAKTTGTAVSDENSIPGQADYQLPNSQDAEGTWNLERRNVMGINIYGQYVPGPWRDNGTTLYNTEHLIPRAKQSHYRYTGNRGRAYEFVPAETLIAEKISALGKNVIIMNTGKMTTLARFLSKAAAEQTSAIEQVVIMGSGFQGYAPFTADNAAACFGDKTLNLGGHIFPHPSFGCDTDFSTYQEYNVFLDPRGAKLTFDMLAEKRVPTLLIPTNATDDAKVKQASIEALKAAGATPEACYTAELLTAIREFEGGDNGGDFALEGVIRLWDMVAALVLMEPELITEAKEDSFVDVDQLDEGLAESDTPYDPLTFDPTVGKTTFTTSGSGLPPKVVISIDVDKTRERMIARLRDSTNAAIIDLACGGN